MDNAKLEQEFTVMFGVMVAPKQMSAILFIATVGGCLTITVWGNDVTGPQVLPEMVTFMAYVPGVIKLKEGLGELAEVPPV